MVHVNDIYLDLVLISSKLKSLDESQSCLVPVDNQESEPSIRNRIFRMMEQFDQ